VSDINTLFSFPFKTDLRLSIVTLIIKYNIVDCKLKILLVKLIKKKNKKNIRLGYCIIILKCYYNIIYGLVKIWIL
jgi:hypothetical protein